MVVFSILVRSAPRSAGREDTRRSADYTLRAQPARIAPRARRHLAHWAPGRKQGLWRKYAGCAVSRPFETPWAANGAPDGMAYLEW